MNLSLVSIVTPCFNEEGGLKSILGSVPSFVNEVIVVDNGSDDNSAQIAKNHNAKVLLEKKKGYGGAILKGLMHVSGEIIVIVDSDGSYRVENLKEIITYMEKGNFEFVSGCRFPLTNSKVMPFVNILANYFISWIIRYLFKVNIVDSQSGMMVFRKSILNKLKIHNLDMGFSQEIKIKAWLAPSIKCDEIHIPYYPRIGKVKFRKIRDGIKNLYDTLILWVRKKEFIN